MNRPKMVTLALAICCVSCEPGKFGRTSESDRWDAVYARKEPSFNTKPNAFLAEVVKGRRPGKALDIGMGQGRNAILLAEMGWDVTGVDISERGLVLAREHAEKLGLKLNAVRAPIEEFDMGDRRWDLIVSMYMHGVTVHNASRIEKALKPGGVLVVEGFHRDVMKQGAKTLNEGSLGFETNGLLRAFPSLRIEHYEDTTGFGDWSNRESPVVRMVARKE